jgi:hypothetical protein
VEGKTTTDGSYAGYAIVTISVSSGSLERILLGFSLNLAESTSLCRETLAITDRGDLYTFRMGSKTQALTHVLSSSTIVLVLQATGDVILLRAWSCHEGTSSNVTLQDYKIMPAPTIIISMVIAGIQTVEDITKEMETNIISSFAKVLGVPPQSVYIPFDKRRWSLGDGYLRDANAGILILKENASIALPSTKTAHINRVEVAKASLFGARNIDANADKSPERRSGGVVVEVHILATSQTQADTIRTLATTTLLSTLLGSLAKTGVQVDGSSVSATVVQPVINTSSPLYVPSTDSSSLFHITAIIAGSVSGGFFLIVAISTIVFVRYKRKHRAGSQVAKTDVPSLTDEQREGLEATLGAGILGMSVPIEGDGNTNDNSQIPGTEPVTPSMYHPMSASHENVEVRYFPLVL